APGRAADAAVAALNRAPGLKAVLLPDSATARSELRTGKVALVVIPGPPMTYWYDPQRQESRLARLAVDDAMQRAGGRQDVQAVANREVTERGSRYIDFLIPGLLGMNIMSTGLWGLGFGVVNARHRKLLKRLVAAPMRKADYLLGQMNGRLVFLVFEVGLLLAFGHWVMDVPVRGSLGAIAFLSLLGGLSFAGLGLLCASRVRTMEAVSGLINLVMLPMWILSGIFFSTARFPEVMQPVIQALPLTALNDALRAVILDGASLASQGGELAIAGAWGLAAFGAALWLFKWR
ncbi:MAG: ABC transporter permease, partial [Gemmatimonadales bacterium]